jgi:hypothetical protein
MKPNSLGALVNIPGIAFLAREKSLPHYRKEKHFHVDHRLTLSAGQHTFNRPGIEFRIAIWRSSSEGGQSKRGFLRSGQLAGAAEADTGAWTAPV